MSMVDRLIEQLQKRGLHIEAGTEPGTLVLRGPNDEKTEAVLAALKRFKPQLLERYTLKTEFIPKSDTPSEERGSEPDPEPEPAGSMRCRMCQRDVSDAENRERLVGVNPFCCLTGCPQRWPRGMNLPTPMPPLKTPAVAATSGKPQLRLFDSTSAVTDLV